jgi:hypothetical protein
VQERAGNTLEAIGISNDFLGRPQLAQQLKERIKWDYMKLKRFCTTKEMVLKLNRQPTEWKKVFASYATDKGLITKMHRELKNLNSPKINEPMQKWANETE